MPTLIATGAFCPADDLAEALGAAGWRVAAPEDVAQAATGAEPAVVVFEGGLGGLADLLAATPSAGAILLHVSREEAVASALCEGIDPTTALERWRASALGQAALFRRMRDRVVLVSRRRFEAAPAAILGDGAADAPLRPRRVDPLALAVAARVIAQLPGPDAAASMLAACVREEDRIDATLDAQEALAAWRRHATLAAGAEAAMQAAGEAAALRRERDAIRDAAERAAAEAAGREQASRDEIGLLREQLVHMQTTLETAWRQREESRVEAAREAQAERDEALKAAEARQIAGDAELAKARETLAARDKALAEAMKRLAALEDAGAEADRLREIEASRSEEIALLREQLAHLQTAFETAWLQKEEVRATASRRPPVHDGLTMPVDLGVAAQPAP